MYVVNEQKRLYQINAIVYCKDYVTFHLQCNEDDEGEKSVNYQKANILH
jgi:REP element-mobilizing transposase RayT